MYQITKELTFCYGHRLLDYDGKCRYLHGHNAKMEITIAAESLDSLGMVIDFTQIKDAMQNWIDAELDHKMLLHKDDPVIPYLQELGEPYYLMEVNPTAENIARMLFERAKHLGLPVIQVKLWETESSSAIYREVD